MNHWLLFAIFIVGGLGGIYALACLANHFAPGTSDADAQWRDRFKDGV